MVAPKTVNFATKRNATYMSETRFPNLLSFYSYSQSLNRCSRARRYADVETKFSGIDKFPFSIRMGFRCGRGHSARIYIKYISVVFAFILAQNGRCSRMLQFIRAWTQLTNTVFLHFFDRSLNL